MSPLAIPGFILLLAATHIIRDLYMRFDMDYEEGSCGPDRWISWGTCVSLGGSRYNYRYFYMRLPQSKLGRDYCNDKDDVWCDLWIRKFAGKWSTHWIPRREFV